jgi:hypothetical protein
MAVMNCQQVQKQLLATSGRRQLMAEARAHVDGCEQCRAWHDRLREIDESVSRDAKASLLNRFLTPPQPSASPMWQRVRITWPRAVAAAAAVLFLGLALSGVLKREHAPAGNSAQDELLARVVERNIALATAETVERRVEVLADLGNDLADGARSLAHVAPGSDLNALADMYVSVISGRRGLVAHADNLPAGESKKVLEPIARRLQSVSDLAEHRSGEVPPAAVEPLRRIAAAARAGRLALDDKIRVALDPRAREERIAQEAPPPGAKVKS